MSGHQNRAPVKLVSLKPSEAVVLPSTAPAAITGRKRPGSDAISLCLANAHSFVAANLGYFLANLLLRRHRFPGTGQIDMAGSAWFTPVLAYGAATLACRMPNGDMRSDGTRCFGPFRKVAHDRQDPGLVHLEQSAQLIHGCLVVVDTDIAERIFLG